jgi:hypothetical protein
MLILLEILHEQKQVSNYTRILLVTINDFVIMKPCTHSRAFNTVTSFADDPGGGNIRASTSLKKHI